MRFDCFIPVCVTYTYINVPRLRIGAEKKHPTFLSFVITTFNLLVSLSNASNYDHKMPKENLYADEKRDMERVSEKAREQDRGRNDQSMLFVSPKSK